MHQDAQATSDLQGLGQHLRRRDGLAGRKVGRTVIIFALSTLRRADHLGAQPHQPVSELAPALHQPLSRMQ